MSDDTRNKSRQYEPVTDSFVQQAFVGCGYLVKVNKSIITLAMYNLVFFLTLIFLGGSITEVCLVLLSGCMQFLCEGLMCTILMYVLADDHQDIAALLAAVCTIVHALCVSCTILVLVDLFIKSH